MSPVGRSVFWALVRKDLYLQRGFMAGGLVGALISVVLMAFGKVGFAVGGILYLTANIVCFIFVSMFSFVTERQEQSRLFALSLPIAGQQYDLAKLVSAFAAYGIPWSILTIIAVGLVPFGPGVGRGVVVYAALIQGSFLALFSVLVAAQLFLRTPTLAALPIIGINFVFTMFMMVLNQPGVVGPITGRVIVWTTPALLAVVSELALVVASLGLAAFTISRERDYL
jgi:ABC-2 type transport system permease protein